MKTTFFETSLDGIWEYTNPGDYELFIRVIMVDREDGVMQVQLVGSEENITDYLADFGDTIDGEPSPITDFQFGG